MSQPKDQEMPTATVDGLVLDELESRTYALQDILGYNSSAFYWLVRVIDEYYHGRINVAAFWTWIYKTLHESGALLLLEDCKIFLLNEDTNLQRLNEYEETIAALVDDPESFRKLCSDWGLPIEYVEWEVFDTQRRIRDIRNKEMQHRVTRFGRPNDVVQSPRVDESSLDVEPSQVANEPALDKNQRPSEHRTESTNKLQTQPSTDTNHTTEMAGANKEQQSTESTKSRVKQSGTSAQPINNEDAEMVQQPTKSPGAQPKQSDFTFEVLRNGGPVMSPQLSRPVDMPVTSAMSAAAPSIAPNAMPAVMPATKSTIKPATARKSVATSKFSDFDPFALLETTKHVESATPAIAGTSGIHKRPIWKSPWKSDTIEFGPIIPQFPTSNVRNEGKSKQSMGPPSAPVSAYKTNGNPHAKQPYKPVESPDQYIEPLSDDEDVPPVPVPDLVGLSTEEQAALVYQQSLDHGERQKAITGKYRSVADHVRAQAEAEKKAQQAQKSGDVDMGGQ
ncbi:hypothetical protein E4T50_14878 [Aureobasidium sp. EXF-12298]|nr:hypothetical protein E4T50_14878 [Aureobasidium sp. EXF-12298]